MQVTTAKDTVWGMNPNPAMARQLAVRDVPSLVYDAVNLEGVAMTLPEVQTILDGITVGGHKISDQNMALNQADAWKYLFRLVSESDFSFSKEVALSIHEIAGIEEALEWGAFRNGNVTISGSDYAPPPPEELDHIILSPIHGKVIKIGDNSILIKKGVFSAGDIRSSQSKFKINNKNIIWFERNSKLDGKLIGFVAESTLCNCEIPDDYRIVIAKKDKVEAGNTILAKLEDNRE